MHNQNLKKKVKNCLFWLELASGLLPFVNTGQNPLKLLISQRVPKDTINKLFCDTVPLLESYKIFLLEILIKTQEQTKMFFI